MSRVCHRASTLWQRAQSTQTFDNGARLSRFAFEKTRQRITVLRRGFAENGSKPPSSSSSSSSSGAEVDPHLAQRHWWARFGLNANPVNVAISGFVGGICGAPCGVGGGTLMVPMLRQLTRLNAQQIAGSSIFAVCIGATWAGVNYLEHGFVRIPVALTLGISSIVFAWMGASVAASISSASLTRATALTLTAAIPFVLFKKQSDPIERNVSNPGANIARGWLNAEPVKKSNQQSIANKPESSSLSSLSLSLKMPIQKQTTNDDENDQESISLLDPAMDAAHKEDERLWQTDRRAWFEKNWRFIGVGMAAGFVSGLIGVGGGIVWTTYMSTFTDFSQKEAVATSMVAIIPGSTVSALTHFRYGHIQLALGLILAVACSAGMSISSELAVRVPDFYLRVAFVILLASTALRMFFL